MKKGFKLSAALLSGLMVLSAATGCSCNKDEDPGKVELPAARKDTDACKTDAQKYSIDCSNITSANFDTYAERDDVLYIDLRNDLAASGGSYTLEHLRGFEMIEFFKYIYGDGEQLFIKSNGADNYHPRFANSVTLLEAIFPKDKTIFLMCESGGRVVHMMRIMEMNGWDMSKVYNIGGMAQYQESKYRVESAKVSDLTVATGTVTSTTTAPTGKFLEDLPAARKDTETCKAADQKYSATCSGVNKDNLEDYMQLEDVVYIDLRNSVASGSVPGSYATEHLHGFEMVEFFATIYDSSADSSGTQLFKKDFSARYTDSVKILEEIFPKDKTIFLMCQSGGRVATMMKLLEHWGYNMDNVYNVGGWNTYGDSEYAMQIGTGTSELTYTTGTFTETSFGHDYTTKAVVGVDGEGKIRYVTVTGECSDADTWGENSKWYNGKAAFLKGLNGKTLADLQTIAGTGEKAAATGNDVVSGATLSSNRVYTAIIKALTPAA